MNILLHGSTNSTNFGDFLFADMVFRFIKENNKVDKIGYVKLSDFFNYYIDNSNKHQAPKVSESDKMIYIPGHYFIVKNNEGSREKLWRLKEFLFTGIMAGILKKDIAIIGIGAGPFRGKIVPSVVKYICNKAKLITVRDDESKQHLSRIGVQNNIIVTSDLVLSFDLKYLVPMTKEFEKELVLKYKDKKFIFVHYNDNEEAMQKFAKAIKEFLLINNDYVVIVGSDSIVKNEKGMFDKFKSIVSTDNVILHEYGNPWELCSVINICDTILTTKLHVGIVGLRLEKSVISFPIHPEKTKRLYKQIGESERCNPLSHSEASGILDLLNKYHGKSIPLNKDLFNKSFENWNKLKDFIEG